MRDGDRNPRAFPPRNGIGSRVSAGGMDNDTREAIALWRLSVLGPLISARHEHGDRRAYFLQAAARIYEDPGGRRVRLSPRTVEAWFYAWRRGGVEALKPSTRADAGGVSGKACRNRDFP